MELHKLKSEDIRAFEPARLRETERDIRKELAMLKMDIYTARNQHTAKVRGLRKSLARLLTIKGAAGKVPAKPAAAKTSKAKKSPK